MQWNDLIGHSQQRQWIERAVGRNRLANTFLFLGPDGVGKRTFALLLAKSLLCHRAPADRLQPCGACPDCAQVEAHTHPDLIEIAKPADRSSLSIDQIIGPEDARHTQGLCYEIGLRPYRGRRKIAIIDDADFLTVECANSMLKTLEEPPANSVLILLSASLQRQLPTIRSRCQIVRFFPLCAADLAQLIQRQGLCDSQEQALRVAEQCDGGLGMVRTLVGGDLPAFRQQLFQLLAQPQLNIVDLAKRLGQFTDEAGKEASLKRMRLKLLLKMAADFYRCVGGWTISLTEGIATDHDEAMQTAVQRRLQHWPGGPAAAIVCWQRCLEAIEQVDRNANQAALIEDWSANLAAAGYC